jgi:putative oxidoreductase
MELGLLVLRAVVGGLFIGHGSQKLFGWFGGAGPDGGYEYNLVLLAVAFSATAIGAGEWSLDHVLGLDAAGTGWGLGAVVAGALAGVAALGLRRLRTPRATDTSPARA